MSCTNIYNSFVNNIINIFLLLHILLTTNSIAYALDYKKNILHWSSSTIFENFTEKSKVFTVVSGNWYYSNNFYIAESSSNYVSSSYIDIELFNFDVEVKLNKLSGSSDNIGFFFMGILVKQMLMGIGLMHMYLCKEWVIGSLANILMNNI